MKRLIFLAVAIALLVGLSVSRTGSISASNKVPVCHFDNGGDFGHVVEVTASSLPAHLAHGDLQFEDIDYYVEDGETCAAIVLPPN
jgi:hypothetical protein